MKAWKPREMSTKKIVRQVHHGFVSVVFRNDPPLVLLQAEDHISHVNIAMTPQQAIEFAKELVEKSKMAKNDSTEASQ